MSDSKKHGWDKFEAGATVDAPRVKHAKKFGIGKSYAVCILGATVWAFVQFASLLLVSFGIADGDFWFLSVITSSLKFAAMAVLALGLFLTWHNVTPEKRQPLGRILPIIILIVIAMSVFRLVVRRASYGGFNTIGIALILILLAVMLLNYRKKPPYVENLWKYAGVTAVFCEITAVLMVVMFMSMQILDFKAVQWVFTFAFYGSTGFEVISAGMLAVYYLGRKRLVRTRY